jgi:hypothetical protein
MIPDTDELDLSELKGTSSDSENYEEKPKSKIKKEVSTIDEDELNEFDNIFDEEDTKKKKKSSDDEDVKIPF